MSASNPNKTFTASGNINPSVFVTLSGDLAVAQSTSGDFPIGVSQINAKLFNSTVAASANDPIGVFGEGQECYLTYGGSVTAGDRLKPDSSGYGVTAAFAADAGAVALEGGASGELHKVRVLRSMNGASGA